MIPEIDWSKHDQYPPSTAHCRCGAVYRSHTKLVRIEKASEARPFAMVSRLPCPICGEQIDNIRRAEHDPEVVVLTKDQHSPLQIRVTDRDWPEDFPHENGNYMCRCYSCKSIFFGHKRRVVCKVCSHKTLEATHQDGSGI